MTIPILSGTPTNMIAVAGSTPATPSNSGAGFSEVLKQSIEAVNGALHEAERREGEQGEQDQVKARAHHRPAPAGSR